MTQINPEHLSTEIAKFRDMRRALQGMVVQCFPIGSKVRDKDTREVGTVRSTVGGHCDFLHVEYSWGTAMADVAELEQFDEPY